MPVGDVPVGAEAASTVTAVGEGGAGAAGPVGAERAVGAERVLGAERPTSDVGPVGAAAAAAAAAMAVWCPDGPGILPQERCGGGPTEERRRTDRGGTERWMTD